MKNKKLKTLKDIKPHYNFYHISGEPIGCSFDDLREAAKEWIEHYQKSNDMAFPYYWKEFLEEHYDEDDLKSLLIAFIKHFFNLEDDIDE